MRSGRVRTTAAAIVVLAALAGCTSSDGSANRATTSTTEPAPLPEGVLVPGGSIVLGGNDAQVTSSFTDGTFRVTTRLEDRSVTFASTEGTLVAPNGMPLRCGDAARGPSEGTLDEAAEVSGATAHLAIETGDEQVDITTVSPATLATHPDGVGRLPRAELTSSVLVTPEQARRLAEEPSDREPEDKLIVHSWEHEFDNGVVVDAELGGALARELFYRVSFTGTGHGGVSTNLGGIPCNERSGLDSYADDATSQLVLLAGGATLRVDGEPVTDTVPDPAMQGEWALATARKGGGKAKVEVFGPDGERIDHWNLAWVDPSTVD